MSSDNTTFLSRIKRGIDKISIRHLQKKIEDLSLIQEFTSGKTGLEIGGPSPIFSASGYIPVYKDAKTVDGCNFSNNTVWENTIHEGPNYRFREQLLGYQFILDATDLGVIKDEQYDFVLSSHSLEHVANPIKALNEWTRVLKPGGLLLVIVPDKNYTFDHNRPYTTFEHLKQDFGMNVDEHDLSHLEEILELHDLSMDKPAGDKFQFKARCLDNFSNRCIHHHVFSFDVLEDLFKLQDLEILFQRSAWPYHMIMGGRKS